MSKEALAKVVQRAISDAGFRRQLNSDPAGALRGFDLSSDEMSALRTGDAGRLTTLGIDQRMSKAFTLGGAVAATRMAQSDLSAGGAAAIDDGTSAGGTIIPHDPESTLTADTDGAAATRSAINDDPDGFLAANAQAVRVGDDWKFADRVAAQGNAAAIEGSPEATAAELASGGTGMAAYPAHGGLAGPSALESTRAGDDWARAGTGLDDSARAGTARLDDATDASGGVSRINDDPNGFLAAADAEASGSAARPNVINDDPNGFLAAADAEASGSVTRANVINDDPNGFLAANARAEGTGGSVETTAFSDQSEEYLTKVGYDTSASANADTSGGTPSHDGTAYLDDSESYLSSIGYDSSAAESAVTDAHDRGDDMASPSAIADDDASGGSGTSEGGPNISH